MKTTYKMIYKNGIWIGIEKKQLLTKEEFKKVYLDKYKNFFNKNK